MLLITAFIHTSQLAFPPTSNKECHAFWTVKVGERSVHLHLRRRSNNAPGLAWQQVVVVEV